MTDISQIALLALNGLAWGLTIALVALGLNVIFGLVEVVNIAHGSLYMLGAVGTFYVFEAVGSFWVGLLVAPVAVGVLGMGIERGLLRPIEDTPDLTLIMTFGLMWILQQVGLIVFGSGTSVIPSPIQATVAIGPRSYPVYRIVVAAIAIVLIVGFYYFLLRTRYGLWMRGVKQDVDMAQCLGIPAKRVYLFTFGIGSFFAAIGGALVAPMTGVNHLMGLDVLTIAFVVVILGGLGSTSGAIIIGVLFGLMQNVGTLFSTLTQARIFTFVVFGVLILIWPDGVEVRNYLDAIQRRLDG